MKKGPQKGDLFKKLKRTYVNYCHITNTGISKEPSEIIIEAF